MSKIQTYPFDPRRTLWLTGFSMPAIAPLCWLALYAGAPPWIIALTPLILLFGVTLSIDHLIGRDHRNVSLDVLMDVENDPYYRRLLFCVTAGFCVATFCACGMAVSGLLSPVQVLILCAGFGFVHAPLVLIGHELGHAISSKRDQRVSRFALALVSYGHFTIEHNTGHHIKVATPEDHASARYGETIYQFAAREIPGVFTAALGAERARLARKGHSWWSLSNTILQSWAMSAGIALSIALLFGPLAIAVFALICAGVWFTISMANYTAHYGILRRMVNGKREPCRPEHSWNSSFFFSNIVFFNLQRHSDHHTNAQKPFQVLSDVDNAPELPSGYPGVFLMMLIPPVWFAVMHPLLLRYMDGDPGRLNTGPARG